MNNQEPHFLKTSLALGCYAIFCCCYPCRPNCILLKSPCSYLYCWYKDIPDSGKCGRKFNLEVWQINDSTAKLNSSNIIFLQYLAMMLFLSYRWVLQVARIIWPERDGFIVVGQRTFTWYTCILSSTWATVLLSFATLLLHKILLFFSMNFI